jgi:hypothetical protein
MILIFVKKKILKSIFLYMDEKFKLVLELVGLDYNELKNLGKIIIPRENLLSDTKYEEIKKLIPDIKKSFSSSFMTCLQKNAEKSQKWPLLNLIRQILSLYGYNMNPIRKADGYTLDGVKKYKRFFIIISKTTN